jgi:AdoMet-dependent rRNA methyltransferase SPB1
LFLNPLLAFKAAKAKKEGEEGEEEGEHSEWSDDDKYEPKLTREQKRANREKDAKLLGKRKKAGIMGDIDDVKDFFRNEQVEEVPEGDLAKASLTKKAKGDDSDADSLPSGYSSMDSEEIAETRALAKKMMRKKFRETAIANSYNRYAFEDNEEVIPSWFKEDESRYSMPNLNLTKAEVDEEKATLKEWNARPSKKVTEAKNRKKMRLVKAMSKIKNKAQVIAAQDLTEGSKMKQIQKLYTKEKAKHKEEKSYVVNRSFSNSGSKKAGRNVKMVDKRLRSDMRNSKMKSKRKGGEGKGKKQKR